MSAWPLIGRADELAVVAESVLGETPGSLVLAGAPGVGKSRLATECAAAAAGRGFRVERIVATRSASSITFGALSAFLPADAAGGSRVQVMKSIASSLLEPDGRLVLLVDDAHHLDDGSAAVIHRLALDGACSLLLTLRTGEPSPDAVTAIWKDGTGERIEVQNLSRLETAELLEAVLGAPVDGGTLRDLWSASRGNPLSLREIVLAATAAGALSDRGGIWHLSGRLVVPDRLRELIGARLAGLEAGPAGAIEHLAVADELGLDTLVALSSREAVDELERRDLIVVERDGRRATVRPAHPLYAEVMRERMTSLRASEVGESLAVALRASGGRRRSDVVRIATWKLDASGDADPALLLEASTSAHLMGDIDLSERLARAAVLAGGGATAAWRLGGLLLKRGRYPEAEEVMAASWPASEGRDRMMLTAIRSQVLTRMGRLDEALEMVEAERAAATDHTFAVRLASRVGELYFISGKPRLALERFEALRDEMDDWLLSTVGAMIAASMATLGRTSDALALASEALAAHARRAAGSDTYGPLKHAVCLATTWNGPLSEASAQADEAYDWALAGGHMQMQAALAGQRALVAVERGQIRAARALFLEMHVAGSEVGDVDIPRTALGGVALTSALLGEVDEAQEAIADLDAAEGPPLVMLEGEVAIRGRAWTAAAAGATSTARAILLDGADAAAREGERAVEVLMLHDLARLGDVSIDARMGAVAASVQGELAPARAAHVAAMRSGDAAALEHAGERLEAAGLMVASAEAFMDAARAYRVEGLGRREAAAAAAARRLSAACDGVRTPRLTEVAAQVPLTQREAEIAAMAARGLSSKQIADSLVVSVRTVDNHLRNIYTKLGVSGRAGLAEAVGVPKSVPTA